MLQSTSYSAERARQTQGAPPEEGGLGDMLAFAMSFLRRRYVTLLALTSLGLALSVGYLKTTPPTYTAAAQVLFDSPKAQFVKQESPLAEPVFDVAQLETQIQIVRSPAIAAEVIKTLDLAHDPDFAPSQWSLGSAWRYLRARFDRTAEAQEAPVDPVIATIRPYLDRLEVKRAGFGNIIEIDFSASSASRAALIANAIADAYINEQINAKLETSRRATAWLQRRLEELRTQALAAQSAVDEYRVKHNLVTSGGKPIDEDQVNDLNTRWVAAAAAASEVAARVSSYEKILKGGGDDEQFVATIGAASPDAMNSQIITALRTQYLEMQRRENEWTARYGAKHQAVVDLRNRMHDMRKSIRAEVLRLAQASRNDYAVALQRQKALEQQLAEAVSRTRGNNAAEVSLHELDARAKGYQKLFETFQQRYMGAVQLESFPLPDARVSSRALPPDSKSKPKTPLVLTFGLLGGLAFGLALGFLRDLTDETLRTAAQVESILGVPCFSMVPLSRKLKRGEGGRAAPHNPQKRIAPTEISIHSSVVAAPHSRFAETIREIKVGVDFHPSKTANQVIGLTSALPDEGKTTIAASLASLMAHGGNRVIIVDCDLRHPSLSARFAPGAAVGVLEVALEGHPLETAIWTDARTKLDILPVHRTNALMHTNELLASPAMRALFDRLRSSYDYVIVDLPPLTPLVDVRATVSFVDGYLLVVDWGRTKVGVIRRALQQAPSVYANVIGVVLNKTDMKAVARYDVRARNYYDERHYARYGGVESD
jgi:polysaccharide biosynthesis transport protein